MTGHSRWIPRPIHTETLQTQASYVRGYVQALEDVLKDLNDICPETPPFPHSYWRGQISLFTKIEDSVTRSLNQSRRILKMILDNLDAE